MDLCAPTSHTFGKSGGETYRSYWLHFANKDCVTFFAVWPSRGRCYFAPLDVQKMIIRAWHEWYKRDAATFAYKPLANPQSWQWLEGVTKAVPVGQDGKVLAGGPPSE